MKLSTLVIFFAISLLFTSSQNERLSALAATTGSAGESPSVSQKPIPTSSKPPESSSQAAAPTSQSSGTTPTSSTQQQQSSDAPTSASSAASSADPSNTPSSAAQPPSGTIPDVSPPTSAPVVTYTSTFTVHPTGTGSSATGTPNPNSPGNSNTSSPQIDVPASTTKTIAIAAGVVGGIVILGGISIVLYRYQKSRASSDWDEEGEVVLRDGQGGFAPGNPFQSTLDQYHRNR
ncbi:18909_t:CDS:1 [Acaulospora morrowiae]|uniref:18909_t:CDS:1 n=1 Tax=Acaulospora morrowiae TaxID=94023 RepID=A0A9N9G5M8_9GLOM|nr:18909_t:CDS:1 [Acaulospora morrowiae]